MTPLRVAPAFEFLPAPGPLVVPEPVSSGIPDLTQRVVDLSWFTKLTFCLIPALPKKVLPAQ